MVVARVIMYCQCIVHTVFIVSSKSLESAHERICSLALREQMNVVHIMEVCFLLTCHRCIQTIRLSFPQCYKGTQCDQGVGFLFFNGLASIIRCLQKCWSVARVRACKCPIVFLVAEMREVPLEKDKQQRKRSIFDSW